MSRIYESWNLSFICLAACTFYVAQLGSGFNIDTVYPLVYKDPASSRPNARESYFGYSVKFLFKQKDNVLDTAKWLLIGSPRANSTFPPHVSLKEPGQVYRCLLKSMKLNSDDNCKPLIIEKDVQNTQFYKDGKDYGWLGSAIDVHSPMNGRIVVCGYRWTNQKLTRNHYMNGVCYWSEHRLSENENFAKLVPIVDDKLQVFATGTPNYAYGQSGFSVHMALKNETEEIIIGAPGIQQWTGAVIRISDKYTNVDTIPTRRKREDNREVLSFGESLIPDVTKVRQLAPNDYFGYSVHSGIFFEDGKVLYVSGAPRASGMKGKVFIFDFLPSSLLDIKVELDGSQLGEYFGSSILAIDLTNDGKADLLVGAPQHSFQSDVYDRYGDEGKVYVYINKDGQLERKEALFGSKTRNARFGTTIASMGDVNCDGYNDVVIGAPYENDKGAVYLYLGGRWGIQPHLQTSYWQRIAAADFVSPLDGLKGFGISLAAADYDDNEYPDLAVGSFMSGHTLVFRSKPVIQLKVLLSPDNSLIDPNGGSIQLKVLSSFDTPIKASPQSTITEICVAFSFYFDAEYVNIPRLSMNSNTLINNHQPFNYTAVVTRVSTSRMFKLTVTNLPYHSQDFSRPAKFRLFAKLLKNVRPLNGQCNPANEVEDQPGSQHVLVTGGNRRNTMDFCETCPVLDRMENSYFESFVSFTSDCRPDQECMEDLEVHASFHDNLKELIIGSKNILSFVVTVKNHGEPSYVTTLDIHLPSHTNLKLTNLCKLFSFSTSEEQLYSCQLSVNPLKKGSTEKMELALDLASIPSGSSGLFSINVEARMRSVEAKGRQTRFNLTVPLITAIDVEILGNSLEEQLTYIRPNSSRNDTVEEAQESIVFHHLYEVRNVLPSPVYEVDVEVLVPDNVFSSDGRTMLNIVRRPPSVEINQNGLQKAIECTAQNETVFRASELQGFLDLGQPIQKQPAEKYAKANRTAFIDCFNTKGIFCTKYVCSAGPLLSGTPISLSLTGSLQLMDILTFIDKKDVFVVSSAARVIIRNPVNVKQPSGHKPDVAIASTYILPQGPPTALGVAAWIIVLSVLGGILLLSLMVFGLYKMGFFKRQRYPMDGLAEDTTPGDGNSEDWSAELPAEEVQ